MKEMRIKTFTTIACLILTILTGGGRATFAGASGGPREAAFNLDPKESKTWVCAFEANDPALAWLDLQSKAGALLHIAVTDSEGKVVATASGDGSFLLVGWVPRSSDTFSLFVKNLSDNKPATFKLTTN